MFSLVEALNFKCFRDLRRPLDNFHILVGPNASGKSSFLDIIGFLSHMVTKGEGVTDAVAKRATNIRDLVWMHQGHAFQLALEAPIPPQVQAKLKNGKHVAVRYEVEVGEHPETQELSILAEILWLLPRGTPEERSETPELSLFPTAPPPRDSIVRPPQKHTPLGWKKVVNKSLESGNDYFSSETSGWSSPFKFGPRRSALGNLPEDEDRFPVAMWFRDILAEGVKVLSLDSRAMRLACPPGSARAFQEDGSNLPLVVDALDKQGQGQKEDWISHLRTSLQTLKDIQIVRRPDDLHTYLKVKYESGLEVPSWAISDGTLRLLAMTLLAYAPNVSGPILIEEPENGIHPRALETVYQSLSSMYDIQVLVATHSPLLVGLADTNQLLCFALTDEGTADVRSGDEHPGLRDWQREVDLGTLFASGVLG